MMMGPDTTFGVLPPSGDRGYAYYAYYADDFDFLEAETHGFDDPIAYVPDADWTVLMQRKSVIICASMGAGKWKCGCVYCYPTAASGGIGDSVPCDTCDPANKSLLAGLLCQPRRRYHTSVTQYMFI
jgi:hypothetical protein